MYHRVANLESDIWEISVSPANFEQHIALLKKKGNVIPLRELAERVAEKKLKRRSIAITFDDGYEDNFLTAKPLLEKYQLPATFFITSGNIGTEKEFWWDELEHVLLYTERLPQALSITLGDQALSYNLHSEALLNEPLRQKHISWRACTEPPPSLRATLFYRLWEELRPLPYTEQQTQLQKIREWAGVAQGGRPENRSMSEEQLKELGQHRLFTIGAHTVTHPALAFHDRPYQQQELTVNKDFLEKITGQEIQLLAYPFGNYDAESVAAAASTPFRAAFTTEEAPIKRQAHPHRLGRYQVKNLTISDFEKNLSRWE
ncbi:polysaccharide deacetylase family protein [soil metagenome]|jgi:peptidoglycan/xylan/chitin deacetylase (PgdA/CDA1 family)